MVNLPVGFLPLLGKFERHCLSAIRIFSVLAAIIRENSDKLPWIENGEGFAFIHLPNRVAPKANDLSAADWLHKKYDIFSRVS